MSLHSRFWIFDLSDVRTGNCSDCAQCIVYYIKLQPKTASCRFENIYFIGKNVCVRWALLILCVCNRSAMSDAMKQMILSANEISSPAHQFARNYIYAWFFFTFPKNDDCWMPMCTATAAIYILYKQPRKKLLICVAHLFSMPCVAYLSNSLIANGYCSIQALTFVCLAPHSPSSRHTAKKNKKWRHTFLKSQRRFLFIHLYTYKVSSLYIYIYPW